MKKNGNVKILALFMPEIKECLISNNFTELKQIISKIPAMDLAEGWHNFSPQEQILLFKLLSVKSATELFESLKFSEQAFLLNYLGDASAVEVLNAMAADERVKLFKDLPQKVHKKFLRLMKKEEAETTEKILNYEKGTAGAFMTTELVELKKDMTARSAILKLQDCLRFDSRVDINSVYVTDEGHRLIGAVELQDLIKAAPDTTVKDIMSSADYIKIYAEISAGEIAKKFKRYNLLDAPVVDSADKLIGIITIDDIVDLIEKEATKDIYEVGKMTAFEGKIISYATATVGELLRRRAGWLILLLIFDFLTGTVLKTFEGALSAAVALTFFIPMLLDTGGNAGAQTSITIIRGLATGDVTLKNVWRVIKVELFTSLIMGLIVGGVAFIRAMVLGQEVIFSLVVGITMFSIVLLAIFTGVFLPLVSKKVGLDPAVLAGPITTSVVDIVGLIIYFKVAQAFLPALR